MLLVGKTALVAGATLAVAAGYVFHEGVIRVDVDENRSGGSHVHFWVPATVVSAGMRLAPQHHLRQAAEQARPYLPVMREIAKELHKYPNAELVDVEGEEGHVRVTVHGGTLTIDAVSKQEKVHVTVPAETIGDVADRLEEVAPGT